jgi:hypothetical protein
MNLEPFGFFYLMCKIHKGQKNGRWRLLNPLGKWVTTQLLSIAQEQDSYFENSFILKELLEKMHVDDDTNIFSCDAVAMYPNIPTDPGLALISNYLRAHHPGIAEPLIAALHIVMKTISFNLEIPTGNKYPARLWAFRQHHCGQSYS